MKENLVQMFNYFVGDSLKMKIKIPLIRNIFV